MTFRLEFELEPLHGAAPIQLGMSRADAEASLLALGCIPNAHSADRSSFEGNSIQIEYDDSGMVESFEFYASADLLIRYEGVNVFDTLAKNLAKKLASREVTLLPETTGEPVELLGVSIYPAQIIAVPPLREADKQYDHWGGNKRALWHWIGMGTRAYFETLAKRPWVPPTGPLRPRASKREQLALERFVHSKFGVGVLIARTGVGDETNLELRFADGVVRKLKSTFVKPA